MKRLSVVVVSAVLAVAILFGSLIGQTGTAHAAAYHAPNRTQRAVVVNAVTHLVTEVNLYVHIADYHAVVSPQLAHTVTAAQYKDVLQLASEYNALPLSVKQHPVLRPMSRLPQIIRRSHYDSWWDAYSTCMSWPASTIISVVGKIFMAFGSLSAGLAILAGATVPGWIVALGVVGAFFFLGASVYCSGYATRWLWDN